MENLNYVASSFWSGDVERVKLSSIQNLYEAVIVIYEAASVEKDISQVCMLIKSHQGYINYFLPN